MRGRSCSVVAARAVPAKRFRQLAKHHAVARYVLLVALREGDIRLLPIDLVSEANSGTLLQLGALPRGEVDVDDLVAVDPNVKPLVGPQVTRDRTDERAPACECEGQNTPRRRRPRNLGEETPSRNQSCLGGDCSYCRAGTAVRKRLVLLTTPGTVLLTTPSTATCQNRGTLGWGLGGLPTCPFRHPSRRRAHPRGPSRIGDTNGDEC